MCSAFGSVANSPNKALALREPETFIPVDVAMFSRLPTSPFVYWLRPGIADVFSEHRPLTSHGWRGRQGLATADNTRFIRTWWESPDATRWVPYSKGSSSRGYYSDPPLVVDWALGGREMLANLSDDGRPRSNIWMLGGTIEEAFFRPGVVWPRRPHKRGYFSILPRGCIFAENGPTATVEATARFDEFALAAMLNSTAFGFLLHLQLSRGVQSQAQTLTYEVGYVFRTPVPDGLSGSYEVELSALGRRSWSLARSLNLGDASSRSFIVPDLLAVRGSSFELRMMAWREQVGSIEDELAGVGARIDELCFDLYGLSGEDRVVIGEGVSGDEVRVSEGRDETALAVELISWCVGVAVGHFDIRLATGELGGPEAPDPFDSLPARSPGMLSSEDGLPLDRPPEGYPVEVSSVLVKDAGHQLDLRGRVWAVFKAIFGIHASAWWSDVGEALDPKGREIESWLSKGFFDSHLKMYSKSRRRAPIYWPLGTASGSYQVWMYASRVTDDSLFRVLTDLAIPKLVLEKRRLSEVVQEAGHNPSASQRRTIDGQAKLVEELEQFVDELTTVVPLWHPDLDDGIVVVLAPLWRLFAHNKAWSRQLKKNWVSLAEGEYDWARLAMRLWPERVVPKCAGDRSLAIAHGLEDVFWIQDEESPARWHSRSIPSARIESLIADRIDPAVKAAIGE